tara:strand:- start:633 stop:1079 length:447 start_codon:yes stop_codon:yes gene_type:complete
MLFNIIFIIILLTLIYGYLVYLISIHSNFKRKVLLVLSVLLLFIVIQFEFFKNLGYPSSDNLPQHFRLISLHKQDNQKSFILLVKDLKNDSPPRLHILSYSKKLDDTLSKAFGDIEKGYNIVGEITDDHSQNYYGIQFKRIKKKLPLK